MTLFEVYGYQSVINLKRKEIFREKNNDIISHALI